MKQPVSDLLRGYSTKYATTAGVVAVELTPRSLLGNATEQELARGWFKPSKYDERLCHYVTVADGALQQLVPGRHFFFTFAEAQSDARKQITRKIALLRKQISELEKRQRALDRIV